MPSAHVRRIDWFRSRIPIELRHVEVARYLRARNEALIRPEGTARVDVDTTRRHVIVRIRRCCGAERGRGRARSRAPASVEWI